MDWLRLEHISKSFPGVKALDDIHFDLSDGEIHALCGENGAGKSTLMNILIGNIQPDSGTIFLAGREVRIHNPQHAFELGLAIVYQHLSLVESMNVAENIFANAPPKNRFGFIDFDDLFRKTRVLLDQLQIVDISPTTLVSQLSPGQKQLIEIAKALAKNPRILILDEPTSSISQKDAAIVFNLIRHMKQKGVSIIYISHRIAEVLSLADRISILKDGKYQGTFNRNEITREELIRRMVGRDIQPMQNESFVQPPVLLQVKSLSGNRFEDISFSLHTGEILGLAGLIGAGKSEIARALFGADGSKGEIRLHGKAVYFHHCADAIHAGIGYVPEERKTEGIFPEMNVTDNIMVTIKTSFLYDSPAAKKVAISYKDKLQISTPSVDQTVDRLSGGNQQKVILARWLHFNPKILIADEPTQGVDIGAKYEIYKILKSLASEGKGIIVISSELPELLTLCDRILIIRNGKVVGEVAASNSSEEEIMLMATG